MRSKQIFRIATALLVFFGPACLQEKQSASDNNRPQLIQKLANPAAVKCLDDGFVLKAFEKNGILEQFLCINPETSMRCEIWSYFRGECSLE